MFFLFFFIKNWTYTIDIKLPNIMSSPYIPEKLPIKNIDWLSLIGKLGEANRAIAGFNGILNAISNPDLLLSPLTRDEAVLSSKIEGTQVDTIDVLKYEAGIKEPSEERKNDILEVLNYRKAIQFGAAETKKRNITLHLVRQLHEILMYGVRGSDKNPREIRKVQNYIGSRAGGIKNARFVPPDPLLVPEYMDNFAEYIESDDRDVVAQAAVLHAQFEIIHPFCDGNGRLGRMLVPLFMYRKGIISRPVLYISKYLELNEMSYKDSLRAITETGDWTQWISFFLDAAIWQANSNYNAAKAIMEYYARTKSRILEMTSSKYAIMLLDAIFSKPIFTQTSIGFEGASRPTVFTLLKKMEEAGIIARISDASGRTGAVYALRELLEIAGGSD